MRNILIINDHMGFSGGGDAIIREEIRGFKEAGYRVNFIGIYKGDGSDEYRECSYLIEKESRLKMKIGKFLGSKRIYRQLEQVINRVNPDIVRVHLISTYIDEVYKALRGLKTIQVLHGPNLFCATSWGNLKKDGAECPLGIGFKCWLKHCVSLAVCVSYCILNLRLQKKYCSSINAFQSPSWFLKRKAEGVGLKNIKVIPNCFRREFYKAVPVYYKEEPIILYAGAVDESKGIFYLPKMLERIKKHINRVKLIICGRGKDEIKLRYEFNILGLTDNVIFMGFVNINDLIGLFGIAKVFLLPSIWAETFAVVGLESLCCGVPVVGTNVGGIPEWLRDRDVGYLVPPRDSNALADSVLELLLDENKRIVIAKRARDYVLETFNPDLYIERAISFMESFTR